MRETKSALLAKLDAYKDAERRAPLHARMLARFIESGAAGDSCDYSHEIVIDETLRFVAYGFDTRHSIDVLVAQIGTGAGDAVIDTEMDDIDTFISREDLREYRDCDYSRTMREMNAAFRGWLRARFSYAANW